MMEDQVQDDEEMLRAIRAHGEFLGMDLETDAEFLW